jgi:hypothetical protein
MIVFLLLMIIAILLFGSSIVLGTIGLILGFIATVLALFFGLYSLSLFLHISLDDLIIYSPVGIFVFAAFVLVIGWLSKAVIGKRKMREAAERRAFMEKRRALFRKPAPNKTEKKARSR